MKAASAPLVALLNGSPALAMADLFTITLSGGAVLRYTSADQAVTIGATTWAVGPLIKRTGIHWKIGVEVDTLKLTIADDGSNRVNGTPIIAFAAAGGFDGARVRIDRAFGVAFGTWTDALFLFSGLVSSLQGARLTIEMDVKSELVLLDAKVPRHVFQSRCLNVVFDATCGASVATFTAASTVAAATGASPASFGSALVNPAGYWDQGYVTFTSGANAGVRRTVKSYAGAGAFVLVQPLPAPLAAGDAFSAVPGCDGLQATCQSKFANQARYRGFPFIPVAETIL